MYGHSGHFEKCHFFNVWTLFETVTRSNIFADIKIYQIRSRNLICLIWRRKIIFLQMAQGLLDADSRSLKSPTLSQTVFALLESRICKDIVKIPKYIQPVPNCYQKVSLLLLSISIITWTSCCWQRYTVCKVRCLIINATCLPPRNSYIFIIIGTLWRIISPLGVPLLYIGPGSGWLLINSVDVLLA